MTEPTGPHDAEPRPDAVAGEPAPQGVPSTEAGPVGSERAGDAPTDSTSADDAPTGSRPWWKRLPWWAWLVIGLVVVAVGVTVAVVATSGGSATPAPTVTAPAVTRTAPAPEPTASPIDHSQGSDLFAALPDTSGQFVLTAAKKAPSWVDDDDAIESYTLTYQGPSTASASSSAPVSEVYEVVVGQWEKPKEATHQAAALVAAQQADPTATTTTDDVTVDGKVVGSVTLTVPQDATADGTAVWTDGTVVVQATGPGADLQRFFDGYGW